MKKSTRLPLILPHFFVILLGVGVLVGHVISLSTHWMVTTTRANHEDSCLLKMRFSWFNTVVTCEPLGCHCLVDYFPGVRTNQQCRNPGCPEGDKLFFVTFSFVLISFLLFTAGMALFLIPSVSHSIAYGFAGVSSALLLIILISFASAWTQAVASDAGVDHVYCAFGPCLSFAGGHQQNASLVRPNGSTVAVWVATAWGPGPGWIIGLITAFGGAAWIVVAWWLTLTTDLYEGVKQQPHDEREGAVVD